MVRRSLCPGPAQTIRVIVHCRGGAWSIRGPATGSISAGYGKSWAAAGFCVVHVRQLKVIGALNEGNPLGVSLEARGLRSCIRTAPSDTLATNVGFLFGEHARSDPWLIFCHPSRGLH